MRDDMQSDVRGDGQGDIRDDVGAVRRSPGTRPVEANEPPAGGDLLADDPSRQGRIVDATPPGSTPSHDRATYSDPVPDDMDPTAPLSPEQTLSYQQDDGPVQFRGNNGRDDSPQQNLEDWRRQDVSEDGTGA
jgi:hypothetical protein